jgi:signal peptidase II
MTDVVQHEDAEMPSARDATAHKRIGLLAVVAIVTYVADLATKIVAVRTLEGEPPVPVVDGLLVLRLVRNPGAAFGLGVGMTLVFTAISVIVVIAILRTARRLRSTSWALALGLLLGGALGNLTDRIARSPGFLVGHVVDFLELPHWPVFNLADSAIVSAGVLMVLLAARDVPFEGRPSGERTSS